MNERELLLVFKDKKQQLEAMKEAQKSVQKEYDAAETAMVEHLTSIGADSTASYDGVGYAKLAKPRLFASCLKENEESLKEYLKEKGRADLIKESVSAPSLSAFVNELVVDGKAIPEIITYYIKQSVRMY